MANVLLKVAFELPSLGTTRVGLRGRHQAANVAVAPATRDCLEAAAIARVPDHALHFERWAEASKLARNKSPALLDLAYGDGVGDSLDIFPAGAPGAPVLMFIHGGYWRSREKEDFAFIGAAMAKAGLMALIIERTDS